MFFNKTTKSFVLIGTVQGGGYNCGHDTVGTFEESTNGVWNKVSAHMDWIKRTLDELGEKVCNN